MKIHPSLLAQLMLSLAGGSGSMAMPHDHAGQGFAPMHCNLPLETAPCVPFTSLNYNPSDKVTIECGTCVTMDAIGDLHLEQGLDVVGKLLFPASRQALKITTPFVIVQGVLVVEQLVAKHVPQPDQLLEFHFVGVEDVIFHPHHNQTYDKCDDGGCNQSKKPFIVAGGTVDFQGLDDSCHTWSRLQSVVDAGAPALSSAAVAPQPRDGCSGTLINESFDVQPSNWDGITAGVATVENGHLTVSERPSGYAGPRVHLPIDCITPNEPYLMKFKFRYRHTSSSATEFVAPYAKMIQHFVGGGNSWLSVLHVYDRGQMDNVIVDTWHTMSMVVEFIDIMADVNQTDDLTIYIAPMSDVDTIDIDDFVLELPPLAAFDDRSSCDSLLLNGKADIMSGTGAHHAYPFYPMGGVLNVVSDEIGPPTSGTSSNFFRNSLRSSKWSSAFSQEIPPECLTKAAIYDFSAYIRVGTAVDRQVSFSLWVDNVEKTIVVCPPSSNEWIHCTSKIRFEEDVEGATSVVLHTRVLEDDSSSLDIADVSMNYVGGRAISLILEDSSGVSECWGPGAEVLVTSHTIQHADSQLAIIDSVDQNGVITLVDPIHKPITVEDDRMTAVEVAILSRNIIFTSAEDDIDDPLHGGHFIVMHTSAPIVQNIVGIETRGNGQQGKLGKYPLHFHMCASVAGSTLSKNSIRNTKQRGIVVHGTNDLYLFENILYETRGHAVMLEDGAEQGNTFERNVGAVGHGVDIRISDDESDTTPATFWITNPKNTWIENVAAGSQFSGFWFEVKTRVRGPSFAMHAEMVPNKLELLHFVDNVSHSNAQGLQTYPQAGYRPENLAVFQNHKSYRNRGSGIFFHAGGRLGIDGGYISDNKIGIDIDMDHSDVISNTKIVGSSPAYEAVVDAIGYSASKYPATSLCGDDDGLVGVRLDSYHDGTLFGATGSTLMNVTFSGFGTGNCAGSSALHVDSENIQYFDTRNTLEGINMLDDSPRVNLCGGEHQVAIRDVDGSMMGEPGYIVSDSDAIRAHPSCISVLNACAAFCPGICLRTMTVMVPSYYGRGELTLNVTGSTADGQIISPISVQDFQTKAMLAPDKDSSQGRLFVTLPAGGSYHGQFFSNMDGQRVWPHYTDLKYEDEVDNCGQDFASFSIDQLVPSPSQCDSLIRNGDFDSGTTDFWWYAGNFGMELINEGAGSSKSLLAPNPNNGGRHVGLGQFLDTRCIEEGYIYTLSANLKLEDTSTGELYICNLNGYSSDEASCPRGNIRFTNRLGEPAHKWQTAGQMQSNNLEWNLMTGSYVADAFDASAYSVYLYITGVPAGINIQIDDVSFVRTDQTSSPTDMPSTSPTHPPSSKASSPPSRIPVPVVPSPFEASNPDSIIFGDGTIRLATESGVDSTVLTKESHIGDIVLTVEIKSRSMSGSGYQPQLVLFVASETTSIDDVTTNDNGFGDFFEPSVVAWTKEKIYFNPDNPESLSYTWFDAKVLGADENYVSKGGSKNIRMNSGFLRLERSGGSVDSYYSFDGESWTPFGGGSVLLPESYQTAPLKLGYRIKREWKSAYDITTYPSIVSDGAVAPGTSSGPQSYFIEGNTETIGTSCSSEGCTLALDAYNSAMLSTETFPGDVIFSVKVENREIFGSGYQSGLALFFTAADATINSVPTGRNEDGAFNEYVIAAVSDKIYPTIDHTWTSMKSQTESGLVSQSGGDGYKNTDGYLKLERTGNVVSAFMSPNGIGWKPIGLPKTLPSNYAGAPIKLGIRTFRNWCSSYNISVMPTVEQS